MSACVVDPQSIDCLEQELTTLAAHLNAGNYRFLEILAEFDRRGGHVGWGIASCAHWLQWKCGISLIAAREKVRVARALPELPLIADAMRRGVLSYCKVRALTRIATKENESFLAHGAHPLAAGERHLVTVHIDEQVLRDEAEEGPSHIEDGPSLPPATVRRLCCDASLVPILKRADGTALDVGRKTRAIPAAMHRALAARDHGCRFPGCTNSRFVDAHHIHHWADGGETKLGNLVMLCRRHHRFVHEYGFAVEGSRQTRACGR
jgi:hypothetical protein